MRVPQWSPHRQEPVAPFKNVTPRLHPAFTSALARVQGADYDALPLAGAGGLQVAGFKHRAGGTEVPGPDGVRRPGQGVHFRHAPQSRVRRGRDPVSVHNPLDPP